MTTTLKPQGTFSRLMAETPPEIYDPWGIVLEYIYSPGDAFPKLLSAGPDKIFDTTDDINNR